MALFFCKRQILFSMGYIPSSFPDLKVFEFPMTIPQYKTSFGDPRSFQTGLIAAPVIA
jgi:hypothetical protein